MRLIFVPQYPAPMRYSEWWYNEFPREFRARGFDVLKLGEKYLSITQRADAQMFSPIDESIRFECEQIKEFTNLKLYDDDMLFLSDISFPGLFANILFHKRCRKNFVFCHATAINNFDYYSPVKTPKFGIETCQASMFRKVFVGSFYHRDKLIKGSKELHWHNTVVTRLPFPPFQYVRNKNKIHFLCSASRPTKQKVNLDLETEIEKLTCRQIYRINADSWQEYYDELSISKFLLITSSEETFGYQIVDAILNGCIPIAPNAFSYPELLPEIHLYPPKAGANKIIDLLETINDIPYLKCKREMDMFYDKLVYEMKE